MKRILHRHYGAPLSVLEVENSPQPEQVPAGSVRVRVVLSPIHQGDLLGVAGSPAAGSTTPISEQGRGPGVEGVGVIDAIGADVDSDLGLAVGTRVAFFPTSGGWSETIVLPATATVVVPDAIPDQVAAQMLVNTITARMLMRAGHNSLPKDQMTDVVVLQTGAGSAVSKLLSKMLIDAGVTPIRLVRSAQSAQVLSDVLPGSPVISTDDPNWQSLVKQHAGDRKIHVAVDGVGGPLLAEVATLLEPQGTVINFGTLGGETTDIRWFVPRALVLKGLSIAYWFNESAEDRKADIAAALRLANSNPELFELGGEYSPSELTAALSHVIERKRGTAFFSFRT
ncbi:hypothetical protein ACIPO9_17425 [Pseudomonas sp. NPDC090203]|uniref:hypothetical protein n=1 Tax=Pseudomonas sp. NPDC090203 TaxID=3364477 RepID=UPI003822CF58